MIVATKFQSSIRNSSAAGVSYHFTDVALTVTETAQQVPEAFEK